MLAAFARDITEQVPEFQFSIEVFSSRAYEIVGIAAASAIDEPERELAVVSLQLERSTGDWVFDLIDGDTRIIALERCGAPTREADLELIRAFLERSTDLVLARLGGAGRSK
jgi:hypothetical protein